MRKKHSDDKKKKKGDHTFNLRTQEREVSLEYESELQDSWDCTCLETPSTPKEKG